MHYRRLILATAFLICTATAAAAVDFTQSVKTFDGKDFVDQDGKPAPQRLGAIVENSLLAMTDPPDKKSQRFWLALKIHEKPKDPDLTPEDIVLIKAALALQPTAIWGQATRMIDPTFKPGQ